MSAAIEFKNIKKAYGSNTILEHFDLSVEEGEFVTIIGSSGCGKTTALKMVNGLIEPDDGDIFVDGENIKKKNLTELRRNIGYAIQGSILFPHMTVEKNISYVPNLLNKKDKARTKAAVSKWMKIVGLDESIKDRYPSELSGGQQQRVGIARAFVAKPKIVFADEPTGNLDSKTTKEVMEMIVGIARRHNETLILVTHDRDIAQYADRIVHLVDGDIVSDEKNQSIITRADAEAEVHTAEKKEALPVEKNVDLSGDKLA